MSDTVDPSETLHSIRGVPSNSSDLWSCNADGYLVHRLVGGDVDALEDLYDRHAQGLYALILRIIGDHDLAETILLDLFWDVWRTVQVYAGQGTVAAWLLQVARTRSIEYLRHQLTASDGSEPYEEPSTR
jgi:RNA polymerase sigma-70 factor, ECF subfamily